MRWLWIGIVIVGGLGAGCDSGSSTQTGAGTPAKINVLATIYPLADMARRVGGERVDVQWLAEAGQRPEDVEPTAELRQRVSRAALVVTGGPWDAWTGAELSREARASRLVEPERMPAAAGADARAYLWLDPAVMREMAEAVRLRLTLIDPAHEAEYRRNADAYVAEVDAVARELDRDLSRGVGHRIVVARPVWGAFCARYRVTPLMPAADGAAEERLTAEDLKEIVRVAKEHGKRAIYVDAAAPAAVRQRVEEKTGLTAVTLDAVGRNAVEGNAWARLMRSNAGQLRKAWE